MVLVEDRWFAVARRDRRLLIVHTYGAAGRLRGGLARSGGGVVAPSPLRERQGRRVRGLAGVVFFRRRELNSKQLPRYAKDLPFARKEPW